jgi:hypothetical protein
MLLELLLIRSLSKLTASQVKHILMDSVVLLKMSVAGNPKTAVLYYFVKSGKIVNAYNALLMADKMSRK